MLLQNDKNVVQASGIPMTKGLKKGVYSLKYNDMMGFYLHEDEPFTFPAKMYGDDDVIIKRAIKKFNSIERNLGVLLTGLKGSGKTVTAKKLCVESGLPVIIIPQCYAGPAFIEFMTNPDLGSCVVFIDEFEKLYYGDSGDRQLEQGSDDMLRILDGPYTTHNLFVFTTNTDRINECLINRPSRIFYRKNYGSLGGKLVREVAEDMLENKSYLEDLIYACSMIPFVSFDILTSIIKESNLFDEKPSECVKYMNLVSEPVEVKVFQVMPDGKRLLEATEDRRLDLMGFRTFEMRKYFIDSEGELTLDNENDIFNYFSIEPQKIKPSGKIGEYIYVDDDGTKFIIKKVEDRDGLMFSEDNIELEPGQSIINKIQLAMIECKMQEKVRLGIENKEVSCEDEANRLPLEPTHKGNIENKSYGCCNG